MRINPHSFTGSDEKALSIMPCSHVAVFCAAQDLMYPVTFIDQPKVDKTGYCKLQDMTISLKKIFNTVRYCYVKPAFRVTLKEFISKHLGIDEKYIICVQGHFIYYNGNNYCSYFNNDDDMVIAVWGLS